ncbi:MAG: GNAT family N-acetyltransferase [Calditrichia bacterium]
MQIEHVEEETKGSFRIMQENREAALMTYSRAGAKMIIIDHTEVSDSLRGMGAGKKLVFAAVDYARKNKLRVLPLCPFAKSVFDKMEEIRDVLR